MFKTRLALNVDYNPDDVMGPESKFGGRKGRGQHFTPNLMEVSKR